MTSASTSEQSPRHDRLDSTASTTSSHHSKSSYTSSQSSSSGPTSPNDEGVVDVSLRTGDREQAGKTEDLAEEFQQMGCDQTSPASPDPFFVSTLTSRIPLDRKGKGRCSDSPPHGGKLASRTGPVHRQAKQTHLMPRPPIPRTSPLYRVDSWESQESQLEVEDNTLHLPLRKLSLAEALNESREGFAKPPVAINERASDKSARLRLSSGSTERSRKIKARSWGRSGTQSARASPTQISNPILDSFTVVQTGRMPQ